MKKLIVFILIVSSSYCFSQQKQCTGFLDLKWYATKQETLNYLKSINYLKVKENSTLSGFDERIILTGKFANADVKQIQIVFYVDKMCIIYVEYGVKSNAFYEKLHDLLVEKYGKSIGFITEYYVWDFNDKSKIYLTENDGVTISYISPLSNKYDKEHRINYENEEKEKLNLNKSNL